MAARRIEPFRASVAYMNKDQKMDAPMESAIQELAAGAPGPDGGRRRGTAVVREAKEVAGMKISLRRPALALVAAAMISTGAAGCVAVVRSAPPATRYEVVGAAPFPGAVWIEGHWVWRFCGWRWVRGHWAARPWRGAVWNRGHWRETRRGWRWMPGHWS